MTQDYSPDFIKDKKKLKKIYRAAFDAKDLTNSEDEFFDFIKGNEKIKINWTNKAKSGAVSNKTLLNFLDEISVETIKGFSGKKRSALILYIKNNFLKDNEIPSEKGMNNTYGAWRPKHREKK